MAFLDFIKNREGQRPVAEQQSQQQQPETYKQQMTRQAGAEKTTPISALPADKKQQIEAIRDTLQTKAQSPDQGNVPDAAAPVDGATNPQPQRQMMMSQDKEAAPLTPTSAQAGTPANERDTSAPSQERTPDRSSERPQTIARPTPSWER